MEKVIFVRAVTGDGGTWLSDEDALVVFCPNCERPVGVDPHIVDRMGCADVDFGRCGGVMPVMLDQWGMPSRTLN